MVIWFCFRLLTCSNFDLLLEEYVKTEEGGLKAIVASSSFIFISHLYESFPEINFSRSTSVKLIHLYEIVSLLDGHYRDISYYISNKRRFICNLLILRKNIAKINTLLNENDAEEHELSIYHIFNDALGKLLPYIEGFNIKAFENVFEEAFVKISTTLGKKLDEDSIKKSSKKFIREVNNLKYLYKKVIKIFIKINKLYNHLLMENSDDRKLKYFRFMLNNEYMSINEPTKKPRNFLLANLINIFNKNFSQNNDISNELTDLKMRVIILKMFITHFS